MSLVEVFLLGIALSMDAFAVAVCKGVALGSRHLAHGLDKVYSNKIFWKQTLIAALFFGFFQGMMPLLGWLLGRQFISYIQEYDHWIAFILLGAIGGKMIYESIWGEEQSCIIDFNVNYKELFLMAIATSIDALVAGLSFSFLQMNMLKAVLIIAMVTFSLSIIGVFMGKKFGEKLGRNSEILGGVILIGLGVKILIEHLLG